MIAMIVGAAKELRLGDPRDPAVHIGPIIDRPAKRKLDAYVAASRTGAKLHFAGVAPSSGIFVAPHIVEIARAEQLREEVFGPILHVVRYRADALDDLLNAIAGSGYGLTLGVHSRLDTTAEQIALRLPAGNVYVNRNMIGAAVGVQPFGGSGRSGTGPKAGGPHYLPRFAVEQTVTVNTAAAGGNLALFGLSDDETDPNAA